MFIRVGESWKDNTLKLYFAQAMKILLNQNRYYFVYIEKIVQERVDWNIMILNFIHVHIYALLYISNYSGLYKKQY